LRSRRLSQTVTQSGPLPQRIAGFAIRGALTWTPTDKILLGEDASLGRRAFLWLRPAGAPALTTARCDIGRRTRLRWLGRGTQGELQWDAFLAPLGSPLPEFIQSEGTLAWRETRLLLEELAAAGQPSKTLPGSLTVASVGAETAEQLPIWRNRSAFGGELRPTNRRNSGPWTCWRVAGAGGGRKPRSGARRSAVGHATARRQDACDVCSALANPTPSSKSLRIWRCRAVNRETAS
jgi:hypothetical protein